MLEWNIVTGDEMLREEIERTKATFDTWFSNCWAKTVSREQMLSPASPVPHVYYEMCMPFEEVKKKYPLMASKECSDCGKGTNIWIEAKFSFCDEYGCEMALCPTCAKKLQKQIRKLTSMANKEVVCEE